MLEEGEAILWKGHPETVPGFRPIHLALAAMGLVFVALGFTALQSTGLIWVDVPEDVTATQSILASLFTAAIGAFGLGMFLGGTLMILGPAFYQRFAPSRVAFVLTDRHAYIETRWFWRHVRRVRIVPSEIEVSPNADGPESTGSVTFWRRVMRKNGRRADKTFRFRHQPDPEGIAEIARHAARG